MSASAPILATKVTFPNQFTSMAGNLFAPPNVDKTKKYPALAIAHPFTGVKDRLLQFTREKWPRKGM